MYNSSPSALICTDLAMGWQTGLDLEIEMKPIAESGDIRRTWNGKAVNLADPAFSLFEVRIRSGEQEQRTPALSQLWPGTVIQLVPPLALADRIATGGTARTLARDPYLPSLRVLDLGYNNDVEHSVAGRVVTLASAALAPIRIYYRPVLNLMVTEPWSVSGREMRGEVSWDLTCQEVGGPD